MAENNLAGEKTFWNVALPYWTWRKRNALGITGTSDTMIIVGTKFFVWGSQLTPEPSRCGTCGTVAPFIIKKGMRFITVFFVIPLIPISGISNMVQCPNCATRYQTG